MGRAMIIICAGVLVSLGIVGISTSNKGKMLAKGTTEYANEIAAKNAAHTAIQIAMQKINKESNWMENHDAPDEKWVDNIDGAETNLYIEPINDIYTNGYWEDDSLRIISKANFAGYNAEVRTVYLKASFSTLVPDFTGSLQFATNSMTPNFGGSASINGDDKSGKCSELGIPTDVPEVSVKGNIGETAYQNMQDEFANLKDSPGDVTKINDLSYEPTDELIARLENSGNAVNITKDYKETLGTADNPGVYFVDEGSNLTGAQSEGYGIMVIRRDASLLYDGELKVAGNFEFHGLVVFENAFNFDGRGTPTIYGSVLVGHTKEYLNDPTVSLQDKTMNVDLSGNIHIQYDCQGQNYAKMAAANAVKQNKYTRVVTYE